MNVERPLLIVEKKREVDKLRIKLEQAETELWRLKQQEEKDKRSNR